MIPTVRSNDQNEVRTGEAAAEKPNRNGRENAVTASNPISISEHSYRFAVIEYMDESSNPNGPSRGTAYATTQLPGTLDGGTNGRWPWRIHSPRARRTTVPGAPY